MVNALSLSFTPKEDDDDNDDDCILLRNCCCTAVREDSRRHSLGHSRSLHLTYTTITRSLQLYTLPLHSHSHHQLYAHATETQHPAPAFGIATDRQGTRRIHTYTLRLQSDIGVQQYYSSVLLIDSSTFLHPSRGWLAPQSQARHGLTHQHHPPLRQHQFTGRAHTPNRLQALRHMSRRESYLPAM